MKPHTRVLILATACAALLALPSGAWARSRHEARRPTRPCRPESTSRYHARPRCPPCPPPTRYYPSQRYYRYSPPARYYPSYGVVAPPVRYYYGPAWYPQPLPVPCYPVVWPGVSINLRF